MSHSHGAGQEAGNGEVDVLLHDRSRVLHCLLQISQVVEREHADLASLLAEVVRLLPPAWQHPDACRARVVLDGREHCSTAFRATNWKQTAEIRAFGHRRGTVEVHYVRELPHCEEGPFLKAEQKLLDLTAKRVARAIERHEMNRRLQTTVKELQVERNALQQSNVRLHKALERVTAEKQAVQEAIVTNVDKVLMPLLRALDQELPEDKKKYVSLLSDNLHEITSPFADKLSRAFMSLTAVEIRICQMIRDGMTTKEIARMRTVSPATVARQRERIRHKLGLIGTDANLATYLRTFLVERS